MWAHILERVYIERVWCIPHTELLQTNIVEKGENQKHHYRGGMTGMGGIEKSVFSVGWGHACDRAPACNAVQ
jgi:hypothetical protein